MKCILLFLTILLSQSARADLAFGYSARTGVGSFCSTQEAYHKGYGNRTITCALDKCREQNIIGGCTRYSHFDDAGNRISTHIAFFRGGRKGSYSYIFSFNSRGTNWEESGNTVDAYHKVAKDRCERDGHSNCIFFTEFYWDASKQEGYKTFSRWSEDRNIP